MRSKIFTGDDEHIVYPMGFQLKGMSGFYGGSSDAYLMVFEDLKPEDGDTPTAVFQLFAGTGFTYNDLNLSLERCHLVVSSTIGTLTSTGSTDLTVTVWTPQEAPIWDLTAISSVASADQVLSVASGTAVQLHYAILVNKSSAPSYLWYAECQEANLVDAETDRNTYVNNSIKVPAGSHGVLSYRSEGITTAANAVIAASGGDPTYEEISSGDQYLVAYKA